MVVTPLVTVAIPTYNRAVLLHSLLSCMVAQETEGRFTYEILVIDDASTDETAQVVEEIRAQSSVPVWYVREAGKGYTVVLNRAVQEFRGQWIAFFDDDQMTHTLWLKQLMCLGLDRDLDMVGGPIRLDLPDSVLASIGPICRDLYGESPDGRNPEQYKEVPPYPAGGNRLVQRRVFEQVGSFDEQMLTGGCDRDFLLRALAVGCTTGWVPEAIGMHLIPPERITYKHIKWYSLQWGCSFAYIDWKRWGAVRTVLSAVGRVGQALLINLPVMLWARLTDDKRTTRDRQALLWRAVGYIRQTLRMTAPRMFPQEHFFSKLEFRRSQESC